jgi:DNA-binding MarR family transcriptional regulator
MSTRNNSNPENLAEQLHSTAIHLLRRLRKVDEASGTTSPRLSALSVVVFNSPITLRGLAAAEQVRPPTMTRIVNALEEQRLILKQRDESDGRSILISATNKGRRLLIEGRNRRIHILAEQIQAIDPAEQATLESALRTIHNIIDRMG